MGDNIAEWMSAWPIEPFLIIPVLAFIESCLFVGLFVSGIFLLGTVSVIYAQGDTSLTLLIGLAFLGACCGDHLGYFIGYTASPYLWKKRWVRKQLLRRKDRYRKFQGMFLKSAPWAICIGRLTPPIRSVFPVLVGASRLPPPVFMICDLIACTIWASGLTLLVLGADTLVNAW